MVIFLRQAGITTSTCRSADAERQAARRQWVSTDQTPLADSMPQRECSRQQSPEVLDGRAFAVAFRFGKPDGHGSMKPSAYCYCAGRGEREGSAVAYVVERAVAACDAVAAGRRSHRASSAQGLGRASDGLSHWDLALLP